MKQKTKICTKCNIEKTLSEFHKHAGHKDGYASNCKDCSHIQAKKYRKKNAVKIKKKQAKYYDENRDRLIKKQEDYRSKNPDQWNKWYSENKEKRKAYDREYLKENFKKRQQTKKKWRSKNKAKGKEYAQKQRDELREYYLLTRLHTEFNISRDKIKLNYPELIETKKMQLKVKRLLKSKNDENTETS